MDTASDRPEDTHREIKPIAIPGIHDHFLPYFLKTVGTARPLRILDVGAGHGALSKRLHEAGFLVTACDMFPERFHFADVECKRVNLTETLPYLDEYFDAIIAVELTEHLLDHEAFFAECARILKPGGKIIISTPNILSLKSRLRFFLTGFYYSFEPLDMDRNDGLQHVSAMTLDQYNYATSRQGLKLKDVSVDILQSTSIALIWLWPILWLGSLYLRVNPRVHNRFKLLLGRILFLTYEKER